MKSSAIVHIHGNLGANATLKNIGGTSLCSFSVAVSVKSSKGDNTTWYRVDLWGRQAETLNEYLTKGKPVYVFGNLTQEEFTDKDNNKRSVLQIRAMDVHLMDRRESTSEPSSHTVNNTIKEEDDIPF
jgi:single-strand DNA-binding protein